MFFHRVDSYNNSYVTNHITKGESSKSSCIRSYTEDRTGHMVYLSNDYLIKETHDLEKQTLFSYSYLDV